MRNGFLLLAGLSFLLLSGCMPVPTSTIKEPLTVRPAEYTSPARAANGAIYNAWAERSLFEDRHARNVGDVLTVNIVETTSAAEKNSSTADNSGSIAFASPTITAGAAGANIQNPYGVTSTSAIKSASKADNAGNNTFTGQITVTVIDVLPNGNLRVGGEKQVTIKNGSQFIRFSGIVNPTNISGANTVQSTQVADAKLEYRSVNSIDGASVLSMFSKVFMAILPF